MASDAAGQEELVVVGGGVAGLVAARRLALNGLRVTVLEASARFGGQLAAHRLAGAELDAGAESFATRGGAVAALLRELGLGERIVTPRPAPAWVYRPDGRAVALPATAVLGIPAQPLAPDVVRAIGLPAALRAWGDRLLPRGAGAHAASLGELVRRRMGRGVLEGLVAPIVRGVHSREPGAVPVETASPRLRELLRRHGSLARAVAAVRASAPAGSQVAGIAGGVFQLAQALHADCERLGVRLRPNSRVEAVRPDGVHVNGQPVAAPVLLAAADPAAEAPARRRITLVTLVARAPGLDAAPRGSGLLVAPGAPGVRARALTHLSAKWSWVRQALPGLHALRLSYDGDPFGGDEDAARRTAAADAAVLLGVPLDGIVDGDVLHWERPLGGSGACAATGQGREAPVRAGELVAGTGLAAVVTQAEEAAARIVRALSGNEAGRR